MFFDSDMKDESLLRLPSKKYISSKNKEPSDIIATLNKIEAKPIMM